jgi:hypothetical protein
MCNILKNRIGPHVMLLYRHLMRIYMKKTSTRRSALGRFCIYGRHYSRKTKKFFRQTSVVVQFAPYNNNNIRAQPRQSLLYYSSASVTTHVQHCSRYIACVYYIIYIRIYIYIFTCHIYTCHPLRPGGGEFAACER